MILLIYLSYVFLSQNLSLLGFRQSQLQKKKETL